MDAGAVATGNSVVAAPDISTWGRQESVFLFSGGKKSFLIVREHKRERCLQFHHVGQLVSCVADSATKFLTDAFFFPFWAFGMLGHWWEKHTLPCDVCPSRLS